LYNFFEDIGAVLFYIGHEFFNFLVLRTVDNKTVGILEKDVEFFGEFSMIEKGVTHFDVAIVFILRLLIFT